MQTEHSARTAGPTNGNANPPMLRPDTLIRPRYCGERLGATTTRTDRAETPPVGFGRESGRTLRAKRGCQVSRAARHEGTHNPNKQPHHHQKQRPSGGALHPLRDDAPDQGRCTRSEEVHCLRIGCSAPTHKNKRGTGKPSHSWPTTSPSTGHKADIGRVLSSFVAPSTHTVPERTKQPRPRPTGIGDEVGAG